VHEERVEVVLSSDQTFGQNVVQTFRQFFPHSLQKKSELYSNFFT